jgi:hypothetical protein
LELNPAELEKIATLYDRVRSIYRKVKPSSDKLLAKEFDEKLRETMMKLSQILKNASLRRE